MTIKNCTNLYSSITQEQKEFLLKAEATDYGHALCLECLNRGNFADVSKWGLFYFNGKYWDNDNAHKLLYEATVSMMQLRLKLAIEANKDLDEKNKQYESIIKSVSTNEGKVNAAMNSFKKLLSIAKDVKFFNRHTHLLNVLNGVVNLKTGELLDHCSDYGFTFMSPVAYNPYAKSDIWVSFLGQVIQDFSVTKDFIQKAVGYSLTGDTREEKLFYLHGETRTGKSTFLQVLKQVMGDDIAKGASFTTFTRNRSGSGEQSFDLAPLHAARLIVASEGESQAKLNESVIKSITGSDTLTAAYKGKDHFNFNPQWKIWLASNYKPNGSVTDDAFWYRFALINFPNSFAGKEDTSLKEALSSKENLEGILNYMVQGAVRWYQENANLGKRLEVPQCFKDALEAVREDLDLVEQFLKDACKVDKDDPNHYESVKTLNDAFQNWSLDNGIDGWQKNTVSKVLKEKGFRVVPKRVELFYLNDEVKDLDLKGKSKNMVAKVVMGVKLNSTLEPWEQ